MATYRQQLKPPYRVLLHPPGPHFVQEILTFENLDPSGDAGIATIHFSHQGDTTLDVRVRVGDLDSLIQQLSLIRDAES